ncbi:unnamed protein product [Rhizoctonia solani]|uniref:DUF6535 domain-containing protein n=1 Tax=Rhizoctonia solani TaxID=456999 RepID=A0A8H3CQ85_9AGAM|nr:unnamed protein product [Rhizoctonia solani]
MLIWDASLVPSTPQLEPALYDMDEHLADQVASLLESTAALHRALSQVISQLPSNPRHLPNLSDLNLNTPASAQASILAPGVPIPSRGWQKDHSPKQRILVEAKGRLLKDGWQDSDDTDMHAARLTDAMLRMGMEDMDNFMTEVCTVHFSHIKRRAPKGSSLIWGGFAVELFEYGHLREFSFHTFVISCNKLSRVQATLVSAIVATFMSETYGNIETMHMQIVNGLWFLSLFMSLATATLCMLVSEWLTWSTSQELRDLSLLYRLIRTAFRSLFMHLSIFLFFAGLLVLMWNESTMAVCVVPSVAVGLFTLYYVSASIRSPLYALLFDIKQFDDNDFRGLRVQIWTPFTLGTHHLLNYLFIAVINPMRKLVRKWHTPSPEVLEPIPQRPELRGDIPDSEKTLTLALETANINMGMNANQTLSPKSTKEGSTLRQRGSSPLRQRGPSPLRDRSPLSVRSQPPSPAPPGIESPQAISRVGTPLSLSAADLVDPEAEHQRKLRATRLRRLTEHEIMRPVKSVCGGVGDF